MPRLPRLLRWLLLAAASACLAGVVALGIMVYAVNARLPDVQTLRSIELPCALIVRASTAPPD